MRLLFPEILTPSVRVTASTVETVHNAMWTHVLAHNVPRWRATVLRGSSPFVTSTRATKMQLAKPHV
jgi:hypothetical protein